MEKQKILAIHKDSWSYVKFRKVILEKVTKKKGLILDNIYTYCPNENKFCFFKTIRQKHLNNYDSIFVYGVRQILLFCIHRKLIRRNSSKVFFFFTGLGFIFINRSEIFSNIIFFIINLLLLDKNDVLIVQNKYDFNLLRQKFKKNQIKIIMGNGHVPIKNKKKYNNDFIRIIFAARAIKNKGLRDLIYIIKKLNKLKIEKKYKFLLFLKIDINNIDKFIDLDSLSKLRNTEIFYNHSNLENKIKKSDIGILTSYREGLSQFLLECISNGLPIISYDVPGCSELIAKNINGFLINNFNNDVYVKKIKSLIENEQKRFEFSNKSLQMALNYSFDRIEKNYIELIDGK